MSLCENQHHANVVEMTSNAVRRVIPEAKLKEQLKRLPLSVQSLQLFVSSQLRESMGEFSDAVEDALFELADHAKSLQHQRDYFQMLRTFCARRHQIEADFLRYIDLKFVELQDTFSEAPDAQVPLLCGERSELSVVCDDDSTVSRMLHALIKTTSVINQHKILALQAFLSAQLSTELSEAQHPLSPLTLFKAIEQSILLLELNEKATLMIWKRFDKTFFQTLGALLDQILLNHNQTIEADSINKYHRIDTQVKVDADLLNASNPEQANPVQSQMVQRSLLIQNRALKAQSGKTKADNAHLIVKNCLTKVIGDASLPGFMQDFLEGPVFNAMQLTQIKYGESSQQWQAGVKFVEQLVWTVCPISDQAHRKRYVFVITELQATLLHHLNTLGLSEDLQQRWLERINAFYQEVLSDYDHPVQINALQAEQVEARPDCQTTLADFKETSEEHEEATVNLKKTIVNLEKTTVDLEETKASLETSEEETQSSPDARDSNVSGQYLNLVDNCVSGLWFEVFPESGSKFRCRLSAIIRSSDRYIFTNRSGVKVAEESRESLARQLQLGRMKTLDDTLLFDRALESVISHLRD